LGRIKFPNLPDILSGIQWKKKKKTGIFFEHQGFSRVPKVLGTSEISFNLYNLPNMIGQKNSKLPNFFWVPWKTNSQEFLQSTKKKIGQHAKKHL
jgi:hypothetical protein